MFSISKLLQKLTGKGRKRLKAADLAEMKPDEVFGTIFKQNAWKGSESVSGTGSDSQQTAAIVDALPELFQRLEIASFLDVPCGDFFWMKNVDLTGVHYIGGDIVPEIVHQNKGYESPSREFIECNLLTDTLPQVDAIFCRDCLVHFRSSHVWQALSNIARSEAKYLITTTFTQRANDREIETGQWRPLNLQAAPFSLPNPVELVDEKCTQDGGAYPDKMLAVWSVDQIRERIADERSAAA